MPIYWHLTHWVLSVALLYWNTSYVCPSTQRVKQLTNLIMKCNKLQLQERLKSRTKPDKCYSTEKPLRYCQKRMIDPEHEEGPRWTDVFGRFHCNTDNTYDLLDSSRGNPNSDLCLSVQTLKFQGNVEQPKCFKNSFKYKLSSDGVKHRMFVKQMVADEKSAIDEDSRSSELTCYYFDDYVKYLFNNDKSRPTSGKSSLFLKSLSHRKENKATQVDEQLVGIKKYRQTKTDSKGKGKHTKCAKHDIILNEGKAEFTENDDTKITYNKSGRRKSLTISRTQSPETVQVIRVDVVCNPSRGSAVTKYKDTKLDTESLSNFDIEDIHLKKSHFADKYLITNTIKTMDENLSSGEKVTLLCKTFKLSKRSQPPVSKPKTITEDRSNNKLIQKESAFKDSNTDILKF